MTSTPALDGSGAFAEAHRWMWDPCGCQSQAKHSRERVSSIYMTKTEAITLISLITRWLSQRCHVRAQSRERHGRWNREAANKSEITNRFGPSPHGDSSDSRADVNLTAASRKSAQAEDSARDRRFRRSR